MKPITQVSDNVMSIAPPNRLWWKFGGLAFAVMGSVGFYVMLTDDGVEQPWIIGTASLGFLVFGLYFLGEVSRFYIDRSESTVTKRWRWVTLRHVKTRQVTPMAVRVTINRNDECDDGANYVNQAYLVHDAGEIKLVSAGSLGTVREIARTLAGSLGVEVYEDRLHKLMGAFTPQTGPGAEPTRTYVDRGKSVPLPTGVETDLDTIAMASAMNDEVF